MLRTSSRNFPLEKASPTWEVRLTRIASSSTLRLPRKCMRAILPASDAVSLAAVCGSCAPALAIQKRTRATEASLRKVMLRNVLSLLDELAVYHRQLPRHVRCQFRVVGYDENGEPEFPIELEQQLMNPFTRAGVQVA